MPRRYERPPWSIDQGVRRNLWVQWDYLVPAPGGFLLPALYFLSLKLHDYPLLRQKLIVSLSNYKTTAVKLVSGKPFPKLTALLLGDMFYLR